MACEKCWNDAYMRSRRDGRSQADHYAELLKERESKPCGAEYESANYFRRLEEEDSLPAAPQEGTVKDACEVCKGESGGVPGNENIVNGVVMCDYCSSKTMEPVSAPTGEVKRWGIQIDNYGDSSFGTYENGLYVLHSDYIAKCQELDKARGESKDHRRQYEDWKQIALNTQARLDKEQKEYAKNVVLVENRATKAESELVEARKALKQVIKKFGVHSQECFTCDANLRRGTHQAGCPIPSIEKLLSEVKP
jgi:hypothetical protein